MNQKSCDINQVISNLHNNCALAKHVDRKLLLTCDLENPGD